MPGTSSFKCKKSIPDNACLTSRKKGQNPLPYIWKSGVLADVSEATERKMMQRDKVGPIPSVLVANYKVDKHAKNFPCGGGI